MRRSKDTIGAQLKRIERLGKKRHATGMLYRNIAETRKSYRVVTLFSLFVSDENTFLIRPHIFEKREAKTAKQWEEWFRNNYGKILREGILPGMSNRTGKFWRVYRVIGWVPGANTRSANTRTRSKRHKAKSPRRKNGHSNLRLRH